MSLEASGSAAAGAAVDELASLLDGAVFAVLTGAGVSTESGIPDYRGPETRRRARNPIRFADYVSSERGRARYWARSMVGWPRVAGARPNAAHAALAELERARRVTAIITQNVDGLHHAAGSREVVELHGRLSEVRCLDCGAVEARDELQARLLEMNPGFDAEAIELAPDGDAELDDAALQGFRVAACASCEGVLKPNVVFFGESVPRDTVDRAYAAVARADALLVVGTSLAVFSGLRFVRRARELGRPIAIVNLGETRGDAEADVRVDGLAGQILPELLRTLVAQR